MKWAVRFFLAANVWHLSIAAARLAMAWFTRPRERVDLELLCDPPASITYHTT